MWGVLLNIIIRISMGFARNIMCIFVAHVGVYHSTRRYEKMGTMPFEVIAGPGTWQSVSEAKREAYVPLGAPATKARGREPGRERHLCPDHSASEVSPS